MQKRKIALALSAVVVGLAACGATIAKIVEPAKPHLVLRSSRMIALPGQPITLTAELVGGEDAESMYCPRVVWSWPDGTESTTESDCPPWAPGVEYARRWMRHGSLAGPGVYVFRVRLEKPAGHVLTVATVELTAVGGE